MSEKQNIKLEDFKIATLNLKTQIGHIAKKRSINLATVENESIDWRILVPVIAVASIFIIIFSQVVVINRIQTRVNIERETASLKKQLESAHNMIDAYGELNDIYAHYTYSGMTEEELSLANRADVMEMFQRLILPQISINTWNITNNTLTFTISDNTLQSINLLAQQIREEPIVDSCSITTASTNGRHDTNQNITIVTANVVIHLKNPMKEVLTG